MLFDFDFPCFVPFLCAREKAAMNEYVSSRIIMDRYLKILRSISYEDTEKKVEAIKKSAIHRMKVVVGGIERWRTRVTFVYA